jgi:hypothetical protein
MMRVLTAVGVIAFALYQFLKVIHNLVRRKHVAQQTGLLDLPFLGALRKDGRKIEGTAVICGGSIAGLLAARICHDHFDRVVIVEAEGWLSTPDAWPDDASELPRKRTRLLQWEAFQSFQAWGTSCLSRLFPDIASECAKSRISLTPALGKLFTSGKQVLTPIGEDNGSSVPKILCAGRPGLETFIRRLVIGRKMYPGIEQIHGTVIGCEKDPKNPQYLSKVVVRQGSNNEITAIPATLIVDCTGPASVGVKTLRRLGFGTSADHDVDRHSLDDLTISYDQAMQYTTFSIPVTDDMIQRFPEQARMVGPICGCLPDWLKDRRLILTQRTDRNIVELLAACWAVEPPNDLQSLETYARSLNFEVPIPEWWYDLIQVLKEAKDKMVTSKGRVPPSAYTQFHRATNMPSNWTAVGDSVMRVNPTFACVTLFLRYHPQ